MAIKVQDLTPSSEAKQRVPQASKPPKQLGKELAVKVAISAVLLASAAGAFFAFVHPTSKPSGHVAAPPVVTITLTQPQAKTVEDVVTLTGTVTAQDPLTIGTEASGLRIESINVEEGDFVKKGQVLATLNSAMLRAQLKQAQAQLLSSQASLKKSIQPNRPEEIQALRAALSEAEANIAQEQAHTKEAKVNYENALVNSRRYARLAHVGAVSFQDAETKQVAADTAHEELLSAQEKQKAARSAADAARQKLLEAESGGRAEDVEISQATIEERKAQIEQLSEQIRETQIVAPDDGLISKRTAHIGDIASVSKPLFSMIRANRLELQAQATESDLPKVHVGQTVKIATSEDGPSTLTGHVWLVSPQVDQTTRLGMVRVQLPCTPALKAGMFVRGEVQLGKHRALTVPVEAVVTRNGQAYIFTLHGNRVTANNIKLGVQNDIFAEVLGGLTDKDAVVVKGARFLSDGDVVRIEQSPQS